MDFALTEEQAILRDSLERFLADAAVFERRRAGTAGIEADLWRGLAELGLAALPFPEAYGGLGCGPLETMLVMERFGRHLVVGPYVASVVLAGRAVLLGGSEDQKQEFIPRLCAGDLKLAFAYAEPQGRWDLADVATTARPDGAGFLLEGRKSVVLYGAEAGLLVVSARTAGGPRERAGLSLFLVDPASPGVSLRGYATHDGGRAAELRFEAVRLGPDALLGPRDGALPVIEAVADHGNAALCAEAVGAMWAVQERTLDYLKVRRQFGQPLAAFQALQHRLVELYMHCELAQSMVYEATLALAGDDPAARGRAVSAAKHEVGKYARAVGEEGVQLHGGIGMTLELPIGHYLKRITMINATLGDPGYHLRRYALLNGGREA